jgi:ABC-type proline/glycine betaine transport system permease subunit
MAGVRTAMVLIIGTATLAALIGAGGLGDLILLGCYGLYLIKLNLLVRLHQLMLLVLLYL